MVSSEQRWRVDRNEKKRCEVKRQSFDENNKLQTPTAIPSQAIAGSWRSMKLK